MVFFMADDDSVTRKKSKKEKKEKKERRSKSERAVEEARPDRLEGDSEVGTRHFPPLSTHHSTKFSFYF
jgi:hypothetical protein